MSSLETVGQYVRQQGRRFTILVAVLRCEQCGKDKLRKMSGWALDCNCPPEEYVKSLYL